MPGISRGCRDIENLLRQRLALVRMAGIQLSAREEPKRDRKDGQRCALARQPHPTASQDMQAGVVEETVGRQRDEWKQAQAKSRIQLLTRHGFDGAFEEWCPGGVASGDQGRVAIENQV